MSLIKTAKRVVTITAAMVMVACLGWSIAQFISYRDHLAHDAGSMPPGRGPSKVVIVELANNRCLYADETVWRSCSDPTKVVPAPINPARPARIEPPPGPVAPMQPPSHPAYERGPFRDLAHSDSDLVVALNNALQAVVAERIRAQEMWEQANSSKEIGLPQILENDAIRTLRAHRATMMADYQNKLSTFTPDHPNMLQLKAQMNQIDQEIKSEADVIKQSLKAHYESALQQEVLLKNKMEEVKREPVRPICDVAGYAPDGTPVCFAPGIR